STRESMKVPRPTFDMTPGMPLPCSLYICSIVPKGIYHAGNLSSWISFAIPGVVNNNIAKKICFCNFKKYVIGA
ncbi:MAG: hypothetical protein PHT62_14115, partial [Desulfotomaculaceae bacterium]|nr:hypothetical protein [Desulfotomaculaceae bacterium]